MIFIHLRNFSLFTNIAIKIQNVTKKKQNLTQNYIFSIRKRIEKMKIEDYTLLYKEKRVTENMNLMQN